LTAAIDGLGLSNFGCSLHMGLFDENVVVYIWSNQLRSFYFWSYKYSIIFLPEVIPLEELASYEIYNLVKREDIEYLPIPQEPKNALFNMWNISKHGDDKYIRINIYSTKNSKQEHFIR